MSSYRYNVIIDVEMNTSGAKGAPEQVRGAFSAMETEAKAASSRIGTQFKSSTDKLIDYTNQQIRQAQASINNTLNTQKIKDVDRAVAQQNKTLGEGTKQLGMWGQAFKGAFIGAVAGITFSTIISGITGIASAIAQAAKGAVQAAADFEATRNAMILFMGSARAADSQLRTLEQLSASTPGLRLDDAQTGAARLQALGFEAKLANDLIVGLAKQKLVSGVTDEGAINRVIINLQQLRAGSPQIQKDIQQMVLAIPSLSREINIAFGSIDKFKKALREDAGAAMDKFAKSLANARVPAAGFNDQMGKLIDQFTIAGREFGKPILGPLSYALKVLSGELKNNRSVWADWGEYVAGVIRGVTYLAQQFSGNGAPQPPTPESEKPWIQKWTGMDDSSYKRWMQNSALKMGGIPGLIIGGIDDLNRIGQSQKKPEASTYPFRFGAFARDSSTPYPYRFGSGAYKPPPPEYDSKTGGGSGSSKKNELPAFGSMTQLVISSGNPQWDSWFNEMGRKFGVDPNVLLLQAGKESGHNSKAVSPKGALGFSQFMPDTAKRFKVNTASIEDSIRGQAQYMNFLLGMFGGDYSKALAGYNAGEGNVQKYGGIPPFKETRDYVSKIKNAYTAKVRGEGSVFGTIDFGAQSDALTKADQDATTRQVIQIWKTMGLIPDDKMVAKFKEYLAEEARAVGELQPSEADVLQMFTLNAISKRTGTIATGGTVGGKLNLRQTPDEQYLTNLREGLNMDQRREALVNRERNMQGEISVLIEDQLLTRKEAYAQNEIDMELLNRRMLGEETLLEFAQSKTDLLARQQDIQKQLNLLEMQNADPQFVAQRRATLASGEKLGLGTDITTLKDRLANWGSNTGLEIERAYLEDIVRLRYQEVDAVISINRSQLELNQKLVYSKTQADAKVAEFLAGQKGITDIVSDTKINLLTTAYSGLDAIAGRLTRSFGAFRDVIKDLIANLLKLALNSLFGKYFSGGGGAAGSAGGGGGFFGLGNIFGGVSGGGITRTPGFNPGYFVGGGGAMAGGIGGLDGLATGGLPGVAGSPESLLGPATGGSLGKFLGMTGKGGALAGIGSMLPFLGLGIGASVGGNSIGGQLLGGIGGLAGGLLGGMATGALSGATMFGGLFGSAAMATGILAPIAVLGLVGAFLLNRNKRRREEERIRNQAMLDAFSGLDKLIADVQSDRIDGASALAQADTIRKNYIDQMSQLKDKKTRNIALKDVSRIDSKIEALKSAVANQASRRERLDLMVPTFATGGSVAMGYQRGPGTGTSDSMMGYFPAAGGFARYSNSEYILDAETTRNVGPHNLDLLRATKGASYGQMRANMPMNGYAQGGGVVGTMPVRNSSPPVIELNITVGLAEEQFAEVISASMKENNGSTQQLAAIVNTLKTLGDNPLAEVLSKQIATKLNGK